MSDKQLQPWRNAVKPLAEFSAVTMPNIPKHAKSFASALNLDASMAAAKTGEVPVGSYMYENSIQDSNMPGKWNQYAGSSSSSAANGIALAASDRSSQPNGQQLTGLAGQ